MTPVRIVGIGASAGGLEAFTELLRNLPTHAGVAYVLVQHLDPTHRSLLSELLARVTTLPVREIVHNSPVEANQIYVIPPNRNLSLENGVLKLSPRKKNGGPARSIDHFLKSLAEDQKENAIAVILSGAASDGAQGLKAVKGAGGLTFAQDEATAKYNSMPRAAAATGCVDFVLSPEKIAAEIARLIRHPASTKGRAAANAKRRREIPPDPSTGANQRFPNGIAWPVPPADANLRKLFLLLRTRTGIDFTFYKINTVRRRLQRRMAASKVKDLEGYLRFLHEHPEEIDTLYEDLLIHVSSFFRNPSSFELLKQKVFPRMVKSHAGTDTMRIWVTACSTGQEAYSIAIAYAEFAEKSPTNVPIQIFATDVNEAVLEQARAGRYSEAELANVSAERLRKYFIRENGHYRVQKAIRDFVVFARHNLITDPPFTRVDLVTCRNVLIYLDPALQQKIIPTFHYAIKPDGFLWLGSSESIGQFGNLFAAVDKTHRLYGKKAAARWLRIERPPKLPPLSIGARPAVRPSSEQDFNVLDAQKEADRVILSKYTPASVLINDELEVLQLRGDVNQFLKLPSGKASFQLLKMARDGLAFPLQKIVHRAKKESRNVREKGIRFAGGRTANIEVVPLKKLKARCYLVFFEKPARTKTAIIPASPGLLRNGNGKVKENGRHEADSRLEIIEVREQINSIQEEYDTAVEELQASNEEVQSSNEELQSLNEELETSNEELESANEELTTLNEELATRNSELRESEQRLREQAQLLSMAPIMARSIRDRIIFWSGGAEQMYGFSEDEAMGQTSHMLLNTHFFEPLEVIQKKLIQTGEWEGEVEHRHKDGRIIQISTKWVLQCDNARKPRAILEVNTDISARKTAEKALRTSEEFNRSILESSPDCIKVLDTAARLIFMNAGGLKLIEISDIKDHEQPYWPDLWEGEGRLQAERSIRLALKGETGRFKAFRPTAKGTPKWWDGIVTPIFGTEGQVEKILCVLRDITEHKCAEEELRQHKDELSAFFETASIGLHWVGPDGVIQWANPAELEMLGYSKEEYEGHHIAEFHANQATVDDMLARLRRGEVLKGYEAQLRTREGALRDVLVNSCVLWNNGQFVHTQSFTLDITEQKREEKARAERARLGALRADISTSVVSGHELQVILKKVTEALVQHLDVAFSRIWTVNDQEDVLELQASAGIYTHLNGAHARVKIGDFKIGRIAQRRLPHLENDVQNDPEIGDPEWARREGMVAFAGYPLIVGNAVLGVLAIFARAPFADSVLHELSFAADSVAQCVQRQRAEELRNQAQEMLSRYTEDLEKSVAERTASLRQTIGELEAFSYSVSHDLRTPLRAMEGYARALLEDCGDKLEPEHRGYLERIVRGAGRLDRLTLDVLAYSRISRTECDLQAIDLNKLVTDIIDQYPQFACAKEHIQAEETLLPVLGHPAFLTQCISNLLGNALKFVDKKTSPLVKISTERAGENVRLLFQDNGIGIAPEHRVRIFEMFGRIHNDKSYEGTGIGLAVVKRAVDRMGGTVDFESELGKGSRFWIELPGTNGHPV